jgi:hypothetical protein
MSPRPDKSVARTIHQHPLAYLLGLEGVALMRAFAGEYDRAFTEARIEEIRGLLDVGASSDPGSTSRHCRWPTDMTAGR